MIVYNYFYGSIEDTYNDVRNKDPPIKYDDVRRWLEKHHIRKTNLRDYNSFIADHPKQEYQIDLFFMNEDEQYKVGLLIIDIFSKFIDVEPLKTKQPDDVLQGLKDGFHNMQGKPESIYSDDEGAFNSKLIQDYFKT